MEYRAEPRFPVRSPIRVIVPGNPARILSCDLIDVSATGMRFLANESVPPDEIVAVEVDSRLVLAEIRYCQPRGDKFVAGVRRLQEIAKGGELRDPGACATEMIWDLRRHISAGGERDPKALAMKALERIVERSEISSDGPEANEFNLPPEPIPPPPALQAADGNRAGTPPMAIPNAREPDEMPRYEPVRLVPVEVLAIDVTDVHAADAPVENGSAEIVSHLPVGAAPIDQTPRQEPAGTVPIDVLQGVVFQAAELLPQQPVAAAPIDQTPRQEPAGTVPIDVIQGVMFQGDVLQGEVLQGDVIEGDVIEGDDTDAPVADVPAANRSAGIQSQAPVFAERPMPEPLAPVASIPIGVPGPTRSGAAETDPFNAVRAKVMARYSADASEASARASRSWRVPLAIAAGLVLACTIGFFLMQHRTQASSLAPPVEVQTRKVDPAAVPAAPAVPPASIPTPDETPAVKVGVHHARLKIVDASWVTLVVDGGKPFQSMLYKGDIHEFDFSQKAFLRLGNASGVEITLDNAPIGPLKDTVVLMELTPHGVEFPKIPPPSTKSPR